jgi:hypothetical protein
MPTQTWESRLDTLTCKTIMAGKLTLWLSWYSVFVAHGLVLVYILGHHTRL